MYIKQLYLFIVQKILDLINFVKSVTAYEKKLCEDDEHYDISSETCKTFICAHGYVKTGKACSKKEIKALTNITVEEARFDNCIAASLPYLFIKSINQANASKLNHVFKSIINSSSETFYSIYSQEGATYFKRERRIDNNEYETIQSNLQNTSSEIWNHITSVFITPYEDQIITELYGFDVERSFHGNRLCSSSKVFGRLRNRA